MKGIFTRSRCLRIGSAFVGVGALLLLMVTGVQAQADSTASPSVTASPMESVSPSETASSSSTASSTETASPTGTASPSTTASPAGTPSSTETASPTESATPAPIDAWTASDIAGTAEAVFGDRYVSTWYSSDQSTIMVGVLDPTAADQAVASTWYPDISVQVVSAPVSRADLDFAVSQVAAVVGADAISVGPDYINGQVMLVTAPDKVASMMAKINNQSNLVASATGNAPAVPGKVTVVVTGGSPVVAGTGSDDSTPSPAAPTVTPTSPKVAGPSVDTGGSVATPSLLWPALTLAMIAVLGGLAVIGLRRRIA